MLTRARVENLRAVDGLIRFEVTGEGGFVLGTHFGTAPVPAEPKTRISVDAQAYRDLRSGALDPQSAFMNQQIRVEGDMSGGDAARARGGCARLSVGAGSPQAA